MVVSAAIDIAAPPEVVRAKFLDFESLPKYHNGFFGSIVPLAENKQQALEPGNKVRVKFGPADGSGQSMDALILNNEPAFFKWRGSIPLLFTGDHAFKFEPSKSIAGGTHFVQEENFSGMFGFLMGDNILGRQAGFAEKTAKNWEAYNRDLKAWCEKK